MVCALEMSQKRIGIGQEENKLKLSFLTPNAIDTIRGGRIFLTININAFIHIGLKLT